MDITNQKKIHGKLLYLGGIQRASYVVKRAKELGIYVVVADYYEDSPAKKIADEGLLIDATDVEELVKYCETNHIEGIMSGYVDVLLKPMVQVAERVGIFCFLTDSILNASTDKYEFTKICNKYDLGIPKIYDVSPQKNNFSDLPYPVFLKPIDASGARGASACWQSNEFLKKYKEAEAYSKKNGVIVSELLRGTEFILDFIVIDGKAYMLSMADRYTLIDDSVAINHPDFMLLPSKNLKNHYNEIEKKVNKMVSEENYKNGLMFFQGYADTDNIKFYEMGCRLGGTWPYIDEFYQSVNPLDLLFNYALKGKMLPEYISDYKPSPFYDGCAAVIYIKSNIKDGIIGKVEGINKLNNCSNVVSVMQYYYEGDKINLNRQIDVLLLGVHIVAEDIKKLKSLVNWVYDTVTFYDSDGNNIISKHYDINEINDNDYIS